MSAMSDDDDTDDLPIPMPPPSLRAALRTARVDDAERSRAIADLHGAELARLDVLKDAIQPVLQQIPDGVDMFDAALMPGPRPRLFIDMIGFVEMAHDKRRYLFIQDTREGRVTLSDSARVDVTVDAVTSYVARRLIEREKALASTGAAPAEGRAPRSLPRLPPHVWRWGRLGLEYLGIAALVVLAWFAGDALYHWLRPAP